MIAIAFIPLIRELDRSFVRLLGKMTQNEDEKLDQLLSQIKDLSEEDRQKILNELQPGILMVFSDSSANQGISIHINGDTEDISKALREFLKAIDAYLMKNSITNSTAYR